MWKHINGRHTEKSVSADACHDMSMRCCSQEVILERFKSADSPLSFSLKIACAGIFDQGWVKTGHKCWLESSKALKTINLHRFCPSFWERIKRIRCQTMQNTHMTKLAWQAYKSYIFMIRTGTQLVWHTQVTTANAHPKSRISLRIGRIWMNESKSGFVLAGSCLRHLWKSIETCLRCTFLIVFQWNWAIKWNYILNLQPPRIKLSLQTWRMQHWLHHSIHGMPEGVTLCLAMCIENNFAGGQERILIHGCVCKHDRAQRHDSLPNYICIKFLPNMVIVSWWIHHTTAALLSCLIAKRTTPHIRVLFSESFANHLLDYRHSTCLLSCRTHTHRKFGHTLRFDALVKEHRNALRPFFGRGPNCLVRFFQPFSTKFRNWAIAALYTHTKPGV